MAKKSTGFSADKYGKTEQTTKEETYYFGKENYKWMLIGIVLIVVGFLLMMGADANTVNGKLDPNSWNEDIFSFRRIRLAPLLVVIGFGIQIYAILKRNRNSV